MKLLVLICSLVLVNLSFADDHEGATHTPNFCTEDKTCTHLMFPKLPNTREESEFIVHILPKSENANIESLQVKLWMDMGHGHGHGSAPVEIKASAEAFHFEVSKAWFVMMGQWQVIVTFKEDGIDRKFIIPIQIDE
jgi:hypothetical protein